MLLHPWNTLGLMTPWVDLAVKADQLGITGKAAQLRHMLTKAVHPMISGVSSFFPVARDWFAVLEDVGYPPLITTPTTGPQGFLR